MADKKALGSKTRDQLLDYLVQRQGGLDTVLRDYHGESIRAALLSGKSFGEVLDDIGEDAGRLAALRSMRLADLASSSGSKATRKGRKRSSRLTEEERGKVKDLVAKVLKSTPWIQMGDVVAGLSKRAGYRAIGKNLSRAQMTAIMKEMREAKLIKVDSKLGEKRLRYAARGDNSKPPAA